MKFQSTRPVRGATRTPRIPPRLCPSFNPRAPCGARHTWTGVLERRVLFQSTRPVRGATTFGSTISVPRPRFQSTRPVRGATTVPIPSARRSRVSIHAPRAGRDALSSDSHNALTVSIHAPRAGRDLYVSVDGLKANSFQSTRPVRGATRQAELHDARQSVSIHAPRAGRDDRRVCAHVDVGAVSIHAPRAGRDFDDSIIADTMAEFQSTRPVRGATRYEEACLEATVFQSTRPVRGATRTRDAACTSAQPFQSTRPVRGATSDDTEPPAPPVFQSTRPVRGATSCAGSSAQWPTSFNPRAPCGARLAGADRLREHLPVSIHAPRAGRDVLAAVRSAVEDLFQSTRPVRGATEVPPALVTQDLFQSTRPVRGATVDVAAGEALLGVSIHAPRAGRDAAMSSAAASTSEFQSTRPVRGATFKQSATGRTGGFQSTRPVRGATVGGDFAWGTDEFQSTRPVRGATRPGCARPRRSPSFNPRAPCGARRARFRPSRSSGTRFNPRAPCGARPCRTPTRASPSSFNPRAPCGARPVRGATP